MRIDFHPAATAELEHSVAWYDSRSRNAAQRFALAIDEALTKIAADPTRFLQIDARHRACSVKNFPFQLVFRLAEDRIFVVAVAHAKRRPDYWLTRR